MADSQYSLASATVNGVGSPTVGAGSATLGLAGFIAPLAQLNQALNTVSLDIRLLTVGQNRLGEALMSLTALLSSARSVFKRGGEKPVAGSESQSNRDGMAATEAANHLGASSLNVSAADIRAIVRSSGEAGMTAGMTPEHVAAIAAALLNSGVSKDVAGASLKQLGTMLSKSDNTTADQLTAWKALGLDPAKVASDMRTDAPTVINSVLERLNRQPAEQQTSLLKVLFDSDEGIGKLLEKPEGLKKAFSLVSDNVPNATSKLEGKGSQAQLAEDAGTPSKIGGDALDASFSRLGRAVTPDMSGPLTSLSVQVDKLSSVAEQYPSIATGLAAVAVTLTSIASVVGEAVATEALTNVAKKILKRTAPRLPLGLGDLISEDNRGGDQDNKHPPQKKNTEGSLGYTGDQARKESRKTKRDKTRGQGNPGNRSQFDVTVQPRAAGPAMGQAQSLVPVAGSGQADSLLGKVAKVGSFLPKRAPGLNLLSAGVDIAQGVANGDTKAVASSAGMVAGSYVGAALGTMIFPGVGTAIGGFLGGITGSWLGEKLATPTDQLGAPDQVSKDLTSAPTQNQQINYSPSIQVTCTGADNSEHIRTIVAQQLQTQFHGEFVPLMTTNALATRRAAALTDGGV